jgi:OmpA family
MKKATGPGKVETSVAPPGAPVGGVIALLFNFDFDDAAVKPEHQAFLLDQLVPRLTAARGLRVFLRGMASKIGNADYNLQLSRRRVEAVRNFLTGRGVSPGQVVTTFTGENLSTSLKADDERDRAVEALFEASDQARFVRDVPIEVNDGFHDRPEPPTVVLGPGRPRHLRLLGGAGAIVESLDPGVMTVVDPVQPGVTPVVATSNNFLLRLHPGVPGDARVIARLPGDAAGSFELARLQGQPPLVRPGVGRIPARFSGLTLPEREVSVAFHYVVVGPPGVTTNRPQRGSDEDQWLSHMNRIYIPQANIRFVRKSSQAVAARGIKGPGVDVSTGAKDMDALVKQSTPTPDTGARFQVFFVGSIRGDQPDFGAFTRDQVCVCQDSLGFIGGRIRAILTTDVLKVAEVLAHEAGHSFGQPDVEKDETLLMFRAALGGERIPPDVALEMNRALKPKK